MGSHIIRRGVPIDVGFPVRTWEVTEWRFVGRNRTRTSLVGLHWTGAENGPGAMFDNMLNHVSALGKAEPLSVHFCIDQKANIYQMADLEMRAAHIGAHDVNSMSVGIEFIGRGSDLTRPQKGIERVRVSDYIHGQRVDYDNLLPKQIEVGARLVSALCRIYALPMQVPEDELGNVVSEQLSKEQLHAFRGVIGHLHASTKTDPGMRLLRAIQSYGRELRGGPSLV